MTDPRTEVREAGRIAALWTGVLLAPLAWLANLELAYLMVRPSCTSGHVLRLHLVGAFFLFVTLAGGGLAWRCWRAAGGAWPDSGGGAVGWTRFMAALGLLGSAVFALVIIAQSVPTFTLHPCQ
jgi:hypothetical protein